MKKILLIDDEPAFLEMMKKPLVSGGYEILLAEDGEEGYEIAKKEKPDLIVLDVMLPVMDGFKVCGLLKNDARFTQIPVILFSAKASDTETALAEEVKADVYLTKMEGSKRLLEEIRRLLGEPTSFRQKE